MEDRRSLRTALSVSLSLEDVKKMGLDRSAETVECLDFGIRTAVTGLRQSGTDNLCE